ncbi:MAG: gamma-glutamyltransferase, partial [Planctomycetaceae bacterium]|nr:gamma-glutamyltransferase [Planctomycetaceae bacterium]
MAATSHPLAVEAAVRVLREGGTAADAAVAASAAMGVLEPMSCGIGGDLFAIYWDSATGTIHGLNASGRSPYALNREVFAERGLDEIPIDGPLSWSVPGCVAGWADLHDRFGKLDWARLFDESIRHAEEGHPVPPVIAG